MDSSELKKWFREIYAPCVMVMCTERASEVAEKRNGLSIEELLGPFGIAKDQLPFRTPAHSYSLREFRVNFVSASDVEPAPSSLAENSLQDALQKASSTVKPLDDYLRLGPHDNDDVVHFVRECLEQPWFTSYRKTILKTFQHQETQMFGQPVGCLVVVSSLDEDPLRCFEKFNSPQFLPSGFRKEQYDPLIARFFVVIHDKSNPESASVDVERLRRLNLSVPLRRGDTFHFIELENDFDSRDDLGEQKRSMQREKGRIWEKFIGNTLFNRGVSRNSNLPSGYNLTNADMTALNNFSHSLLIAGIIPNLENRLKVLNARVAEKRSGLRNTITHFWRQTSRASTPNAGESARASQASKVRYPYLSIESNIRLLADLAFMVEDYDLAFANYRIVREDFKTDRAMLHHGSAQEMMAVATFMKTGAQPKVLEYVAKALTSYTDALSDAKNSLEQDRRKERVALAARYLTNCTLLMIDIVLSLGAATARTYRETSDRLAIAALDETPLASAVLLEQTGMFLLYQELASTNQWTFRDVREKVRKQISAEGRLKVRLRKFGFHLSLASRLYAECGNVEHSLRCLACVRNIYSPQWSAISDNIDFHIGNQCASLGDWKTGVSSLSKILARGKQAEEKQEFLIHEIHEIMKKAGESQSDGDWDIALPLVDDQNIVVQSQMNASLLPLVETQRMNQLEEKEVFESGEQQEQPGPVRQGQKTTHKAAKRREEETWKSMEEHLEKFAPSQGSEDSKSLSSFQRRKGRLSQTIPEPCYCDEPIFLDLPLTNPSYFVLDISDIHLEAELVDSEGVKWKTFSEGINVVPVKEVSIDPKERKIVRLTVIPKVPGQLTIIGVRWRLFGIGPVFRNFDIRGEPLNDTKANIVSGARATDLRLQKTVQSSSAWLGAEMKLDKEDALEGEILCSELELINLGKSAIKGPIFVSASHSCVLFSGATSDSDYIIRESASLLDDAGKVIKLPVDDLETGIPIAVPFCLRVPNSAGLTTFRFLLKYSDGSVSRHLRFSLPLHVHASLAVTAECFPSPLQVGEHLLSLTARNISRQSEAKFRLSKVHALGRIWSLKNCDQCASGSFHVPVSVPPGESQTFLWTLVPPDIDSSHLVRSYGNVSANPLEKKEEEEDSLSDNAKTHFLCLDNAKEVLAARQAAKEKYLKYKDLMQAEGKLPVSIQEIRRLNRSGASQEDVAFHFLNELEKKTMPAEGEPEPHSINSLLFGERQSLLHLIVEWEDLYGTIHGQHEVLNLVVHPPENPFVVSLEYPKSVTRRVVPTILRVRNVSTSVQTGEPILFVENGNGFSWVGLTKCRIPDLQPNDEFVLPLRAVFRSSGQFELNTFKIQHQSGKKTFHNRFFITVHNHIERSAEREEKLKVMPSEFEGSSLFTQSMLDESSLWAERSFPPRKTSLSATSSHMDPSSSPPAEPNKTDGLELSPLKDTLNSPLENTPFGSNVSEETHELASVQDSNVREETHELGSVPDLASVTSSTALNHYSAEEAAEAKTSEIEQNDRTEASEVLEDGTITLEQEENGQTTILHQVVEDGVEESTLALLAEKSENVRDDDAFANPPIVPRPPSPESRKEPLSAVSQSSLPSKRSLNRQSTAMLEQELANVLTSDEEDIDTSYNEEEIEKVLNSED